MKWMKHFLVAIVPLVLVFSIAHAEEAKEGHEAAPSHEGKAEKGAASLENTLYIELKDGRVVIQLLPEVAPNHVARIKELARDKFYDGIVFHRVIDGFMAQTGDPTGTGTGGSDKPDLKAEFSETPHDRGAVSMARSSDPDSANSQFFIVLEDSHFLDGQYTVFGKVTEGMDIVDKIKKGDPRQNGSVEDPDKMISVRVAADVAE